MFHVALKPFFALLQKLEDIMEGLLSSLVKAFQSFEFTFGYAENFTTSSRLAYDANLVINRFFTLLLQLFDSIFISGRKQSSRTTIS
jgi:hypothetical protein